MSFLQGLTMDVVNGSFQCEQKENRSSEEAHNGDIVSPVPSRPGVAAEGGSSETSDSDSSSSVDSDWTPRLPASTKASPFFGGKNNHQGRKVMIGGFLLTVLVLAGVGVSVVVTKFALRQGSGSANQGRSTVVPTVDQDKIGLSASSGGSKEPPIPSPVPSPFRAGTAFPGEEEEPCVVSPSGAPPVDEDKPCVVIPPGAQPVHEDEPSIGSSPEAASASIAPTVVKTPFPGDEEQQEGAGPETPHSGNETDGGVEGVSADPRPHGARGVSKWKAALALGGAALLAPHVAHAALGPRSVTRCGYGDGCKLCVTDGGEATTYWDLNQPELPGGCQVPWLSAELKGESAQAGFTPSFYSSLETSVDGVTVSKSVHHGRSI